MNDSIFTITSNLPLTSSVFELRLSGDTSSITSPGQFVNIKLDHLFLRRPISVSDVNDDELTLIYKVVGRGTEQMAGLTPGTLLSVLTGLGNGYDLSAAGDAPLLLGGGVGIPPLYLLAKELRAQNKAVQVILGFNTKEEVFYENEFRALGCQVTVATVDGSYGIKGFVTDALPRDYSYFYTCGPLPMLKSVYRSTKTSGEFSLEERMGCGFGACMGCSMKVKDLSGKSPDGIIFKRVCKEGPVFKKEELLWED